jgi:hypothetical protein
VLKATIRAVRVLLGEASAVRGNGVSHVQKGDIGTGSCQAAGVSRQKPSGGRKDARKPSVFRWRGLVPLPWYAKFNMALAQSKLTAQGQISVPAETEHPRHGSAHPTCSSSRSAAF